MKMKELVVYSMRGAFVRSRVAAVARGLLLGLIALTPICSAADPPKPLQIYFIDVEGGQSTLFVTPGGESLLIDTGWFGNNGRDADRIVAAAKSAGISKLDFVLLTHYHADHAGGVPQLADRIPIGAFVDHGENRELDSSGTRQMFAAYQNVLAAKHIKRIIAKPGDILPITGMTVTVVSADGVLLDKPLPRAGSPNPACGVSEDLAADSSENIRSLGTLVTYEKLRILDLGDLTWDKEKSLMCPVNKLGRVDIFVVSHHGSASSDSRALVDGISARVAVMDNSDVKGNNPATWLRVHSAPGLEDLWQLHSVPQRSLAVRAHLYFAGQNSGVYNVPDSFIANLSGPDAGNYLKIVAWNDGNFDVYNSRTNATKHYSAR
jgi:beta-lactamase superfamily II metal-dependent hydrolase